jgi:hypothetical protein
MNFQLFYSEENGSGCLQNFTAYLPDFSVSYPKDPQYKSLSSSKLNFYVLIWLCFTFAVYVQLRLMLNLHRGCTYMTKGKHEAIYTQCNKILQYNIIYVLTFMKAEFLSISVHEFMKWLPEGIIGLPYSGGK